MGKFLSCALVIHSQALSRAGAAAVLASDFGIVEIVQLNSAENLTQHLKASQNWAILVVEPEVEGFGGIEGLTQIRKTFPWLRVAVLSESDDREYVLKALAAGAHGIVAAGSPIEEVVETFRAAIEGHIHVPDSIADVAEAPKPHETYSGSRDASALTARQMEVVRLISSGFSNKEIGRKLNISESTVKVHVSAIFRMLGVNNRVSAVAAIEGLPLFRRASDRAAAQRTILLD